MKEYIEERAIQIANYIIDENAAGSSHNSDNEFFFRHGILYPRTKKESLGACDFRKAFDVHLTGCRRCQVRWSAFHPKSVSFFDSISGIHV